MIITCDTNVLVSGVLFDGPPRHILKLVARGDITNVTSLDILKEARDVLMRPKFGLSPSQVKAIIETFDDTFESVVPQKKVCVIKKDPTDDRILEAALAGNAQYIVSGDKHLLDLGTWRRIEILRPAEFLEKT